jgi:hypothetical protein
VVRTKARQRKENEERDVFGTKKLKPWRHLSLGHDRKLEDEVDEK